MPNHQFTQLDSQLFIDSLIKQDNEWRQLLSDWNPLTTIDIVQPNRTFSVAYNQNANADIIVSDQWSNEAPLPSQLQQRIENTPNSVALGLPVEAGFLDVWHHQGEAKAVYYQTCGDQTHHRIMFNAALAQDYPLEDAVVLARAFTTQLEFQLSNTTQTCWPENRYYFPSPLTANHPLTSHLQWRCNDCAVAPFQDVLNTEEMSLYPVVDSVEWIERLLKMGIKTLQLRIKNSQQPDLEAQIKKAITLGKQYQAQLYINDYWQLAIEHGAYGIHLGQEDLETANLAKIQQAGLRLGISTHGYYEILRAIEFNPSYIALGHIFPTTTKEMPSQPQGLERLQRYQQLIGNDFPTVAIGGINYDRAEAVWRTGVNSLAVVRAITEADDPLLAISQFHALLENENRADSNNNAGNSNYV